MCPVSVTMCLIRLETASCCLFNMRAELSSNVGRDCWDMISPATLTNPAKKMPGSGAAVPLATLINTSIGWVGHHYFHGLQVHGLSSEILRSYFIWVFWRRDQMYISLGLWHGPSPFLSPWIGMVRSEVWRIDGRWSGDCPGASPAYQLSTQLCCSYLDCTIRRASTCDTIIILRLILIVILWTAGTGVLR